MVPTAQERGVASVALQGHHKGDADAEDEPQHDRAHVVTAYLENVPASGYAAGSSRWDGG
eukprot:6204811-Pleurochrysis_carterae.AAC.5